MEDKIKQWLEKSGYPLELFAYKTAVANGFICEKSQIYQDIENETPREIDLVAYRISGPEKQYSYEIQLIIECKKSEKPLVVLSSEHKPKLRYEYLFGHDVAIDLLLGNGHTYFNLVDIDPCSLKNNIGPFAEDIFIGYSIVQAFSNSDENIYKGIMSLAKAYSFYENEYRDLVYSSREQSYGGLWFRMPIVILLVDAPIYNSRLNSDGEIEIEESSWSSILTRLPWLIGKFDAEKLLNIQVVRKEYFNTFLSHLLNFHDFIMNNDLVLQKT